MTLMRRWWWVLVVPSYAMGLYEAQMAYRSGWTIYGMLGLVVFTGMPAVALFSCWRRRALARK